LRTPLESVEVSANVIFLYTSKSLWVQSLQKYFPILSFLLEVQPEDRSTDIPWELAQNAEYQALPVTYQPGIYTGDPHV
jgi:hypothetical protein